MKLTTIVNTIKTIQQDGIQTAINNLSNGYIDPEFFPIVKTKYGDLYYRLHVNDIVNTFEHYSSLANITKEDIIFDIGAFIGGFAIPASRKAKLVCAFEPLYFDDLNRNACLNGRSNLRPYAVGLGERDGTTFVSYFKESMISTRTFSQMKELTRVTPTYLKCNCEGAEWLLTPEDFDGIKTIEIQFHYALTIKSNIDLLDWLRNEYQCTETVTQTDSASGIYMVRDVHGVKSDCL